ncbi:hypothetical protein [Mangrovibacterium marinum]|uniref:Uncharacterized protein n=1 Tax=Mangrovibacterium marinum TaxID=1639118 RepID=A0A2T5C153_9BACT|nr:hypothetical protein [Mangrovibacterium marinum]PTN08366.1 hypothetical protein C8N47_109102 [Mangrovibacterium marinum]
MELDQLKNAWNKFSDKQASRHRLDETELRRMLKRRTNGLIDRIDRNVRIGFAVIVALVLFFLIDDFYLTPTFADGATVPAWIYLIDSINTIILVGTFGFFWNQYKEAKKHYSQSNDMRQVLSDSIQALMKFRRLFYGALSVFLLVIVISALAGFFGNPDVQLETIWAERNHAVLFTGLALLVAIVALIFLVFHWGFRRLYGRYIKQLKNTLAELDEIG